MQSPSYTWQVPGVSASAQTQKHTAGFYELTFLNLECYKDKIVFAINRFETLRILCLRSVVNDTVSSPPFLVRSVFAPFLGPFDSKEL